MTTVIIIVCVIFYIAVVVFDVDCRTTKDVKIHNGLLWPTITSSNREATSKDVRMACIWPLVFVVWFIKVIVWLINDALVLFLLVFGFKYKETRCFKFIDRKFNP